MAFPPNASKLAAYRSASVHSGVDAADPHRLVVMLMDGALERIATARGLMSNGTGGAERAQLLHRAVAIIDELRNSLNFKSGAFGPLNSLLHNVVWSPVRWPFHPMHQNLPRIAAPRCIRGSMPRIRTA